MTKKIFNRIFVLALIVVVGISCSEDNPIFQYDHFEGCTTPGDIEVLTKIFAKLTQ